MLEHRLVLIGISIAVLLLGANGAGLQREELKQGSSNVAVKVVSSKEMDKLLERYPGAVKLIPKEKKTQTVDGVDQRETIDVYTYKLGGRINGDGLVGYDSHDYSWPEPRDVSLTLSYPSSGAGAIVTYVEILVYQTSNSGRAYVISGGIDYRYITFVIEAEHTNYFDYTSRIFGTY